MAFRQSVSSFSDLSVDKRLESVNSFLKKNTTPVLLKIVRLTRNKPLIQKS